MSDTKQVEQVVASAVDATGRIDPAEIADGVLFLASREAGYITGVVLAVDGGMSM